MVVKVDGDGQHNLSIISKFKNEIFYKYRSIQRLQKIIFERI